MATPETTETRSAAVVVQKDEAPSWWQPVPANGHCEVRVSPRNVPGLPWSTGTQTVAPGGHIREHQHPEHDEVLHYFEGEGIAVIDGEEFPIRPGTTIYVGPNRRHKFINTGTGPMSFFWFMLPGGLEDFFEAIGRDRTPGQPAPEPFARPADVLEIERRTVFSNVGNLE